MTLKIQLSPEIESRLKDAASRDGIDEATYALKILEKDLASTPVIRDQATLERLKRWDDEDETDDPDEIAHRQQEWKEFCDAMNEHSTRGYLIYP